MNSEERIRHEEDARKPAAGEIAPPLPKRGGRKTAEPPAQQSAVRLDDVQRFDVARRADGPFIEAEADSEVREIRGVAIITA
jgi:hypothetical protein